MQAVVDMADSVLAAHIVAVAGFGIVADIAGIVVFVDMDAAAHIVGAFAVDNRARRARSAVLGIALAARIVAGFSMALAAPAGSSSARGLAR